MSDDDNDDDDLHKHSDNTKHSREVTISRISSAVTTTKQELMSAIVSLCNLPSSQEVDIAH